MSFYDISHISYNNLLEITKYQAPYKNSNNAYPLGDRRYSDRHFRKEEDGSFSLWYADRQIVDGLLTDTLDDGQKRNKIYYEGRKLAVVHPDNSIEFISKYYGQGENMLLSAGLRGLLHNDASKGGLMLELGNYIHPVFIGLRVDCRTGRAVTDYKVFKTVIDRKKANLYMKQYEEFKRVAPVMYQSMGDRGINEVYDDLLNEYGMAKFVGLGDRDVMPLVKENRPVDALCVIGIKQNWNILYEAKRRAHLRAENQPVPEDSYRLYPRTKERTLARFKKEFRGIAVASEPTLFNYEELEAGKGIPSSKWVYKITVDGKQVVRI
jgi:hypothetical protein